MIVSVPCRFVLTADIATGLLSVLLMHRKNGDDDAEEHRKIREQRALKLDDGKRFD